MGEVQPVTNLVRHADEDARSAFNSGDWKILVAYWTAMFSLWLALLTPIFITVALKISRITSASEKAQWLGLVLSLGAAAAMVSGPIWGAISDRTTSRFGRRRPWIAIGSLILLAGLVIMGVSTTPIMLGAGWLICQIGSNASSAAFHAVMSDVIPENQRGIASALAGASVTAAMVTGVYITQFTQGSSLVMFVAPWLVMPFALTFFFMVVPDAPAAPKSDKGTGSVGLFKKIGLGALRSRDFSWAFSSRFLVILSYSFSSTYQVYYLTDHLAVKPGEVARFMVMSTSVMGVLSLIFSFSGGWLSDRFRRRKPFVAGAAVMLAIGMTGTALAQSFDQFLIAAALVAIGQGLYNATDIALCVEVLPDRDAAARDLGIMYVASSLPQSLAPIIAPLVLALPMWGLAGSNYVALFAFAAVLALLGGLAVIPIRKAR